MSMHGYLFIYLHIFLYAFFLTGEKCQQHWIKGERLVFLIPRSIGTSWYSYRFMTFWTFCRFYRQSIDRDRYK